MHDVKNPQKQLKYPHIGPWMLGYVEIDRENAFEPISTALSYTS